MRKLFALMFAAWMIQSCDNGNDTKEAAKEANKDMMKENETAKDIREDIKFAMDAAEANYMEIKLGQLAQTNAASQDVKNLGMMMSTDHSKANDELMALAQTKNITLPAGLTKEGQDEYDELAKKKGADFDKAYAEKMVKSHKDAIDLFQKEADRGDDPDLKSWAAGKLSALQHHKQTAEGVHDKLK